MTKSWDLLKNRLRALADRRGFKAELARKMGVPQTLINRYLSGERTPGIDQLDKFADALGVQPWELIKPDNAIPTPQPENPTVEALTKVIADQEKRIQELEAKLAGSPAHSLVKGRVVVEGGDIADRRFIADFLSGATVHEIEVLKESVTAMISRRKRSEGSSSETA